MADAADQVVNGTDNKLPSPTQEIVERQAAMRTRLAAIARTLEDILVRVPGREPRPLPADLGGPLTERRFLAAMQGLTEQLDRFLIEAESRVAEIDALY